MENINGAKVLITGASGFIGSSLAVKLKALGAEIHGVSTRKQERSLNVDTWHKGDLSDVTTARRIVKESSPRFIFHLAAVASGKLELSLAQQTYHNNLTSTVNMLTAATESQVERMIVAGSMEEPENGAEKMVPSSPYAASKYAGTMYAKMFNRVYGTPVVIPRIFKVYGPGDKNVKRLLPYVIQSLYKGHKPQLTHGSRAVDWIYIDDLVEALVAMTTAKKIDGQIIDLGSGKAYSVRQVAEKIETTIDSGVKIEFGKIPDRKFEYDRVADLRPAKRLLNWEPTVTIDAGLKKTITWYKQYFSAGNILLLLSEAYPMWAI